MRSFPGAAFPLELKFLVVFFSMRILPDCFKYAGTINEKKLKRSVQHITLPPVLGLDRCKT